MASEITITPTQAIKLLIKMARVKQPCVLWGPPGIGKSDIVRLAAESTGNSVIDLRTVQLDPVDLRGLPYTQEISGARISRWAVPDFLPTDGSGTLFLDEFNRSAISVQNACLQLLLDRKLGDYTLPDGWNIVLACNRESDGGGVSKMSAAACNRVIHYYLEPDVDDWCRWAISAGLDPLTYAFIRFKPELLHQFDRNEKAFPTPRSWSFVDRMLRDGLDADTELPCIAGAIGHGAAIEFIAFRRLWKSLPNIDNILTNPHNAPVPDGSNSGVLYAVATALGRKAEHSNWHRIHTYGKRMPAEYFALIIKDATARDATLCATAEYIRYQAENN